MDQQDKGGSYSFKLIRMAWRIHEQVCRLVIDNRIRNRVTGTVWLLGRDEPLRLDLKGNALPDLAGCLLTLENPAARAAPLEGLAILQNGVCGELTASRKVRMPTVDLTEWLDSDHDTPPPCVWTNGTYIEWFSESNGRVVIELYNPTVKIELSEPLWTLTDGEIHATQEANSEAMCDFMADFMARLNASITDPPTWQHQPAPADLDPPDPTEPPLSHNTFLQQIMLIEKQPQKSLRTILARDNIHPPSIHSLPPEDIPHHLDELIHALADHHIFLGFTNHLSDPELYSILVHDFIEELHPDLPKDSGWNHHIDMTEYSPHEDPCDLYLKYYADPFWRKRWEDEFPDMKIPPHENPPFNRDERLPKPKYHP